MNFSNILKKIKINGCKFLLKDIEYKYISDKINENLEKNMSLKKSVTLAIREFNKNSEIKYFNNSQTSILIENILLESTEKPGRNKRSVERPGGGFNLSNSEVLHDTSDVSISVEINPMDSTGNLQLHYVNIVKNGVNKRIPCSSEEQARMIARNFNINSF